LNRVKSNVERLTRMINELLDLSRIEAGKVELNLGDVRMRELISDIVEGLQTMAREKGVTLRTHQPDDLPTIRGDRDKLHQVLTNLIQNAIKFTPTGGRVEVESQLWDDGYLQVGVIDTGSGIPSHELEKVFEKFYRGEAGSQDDQRWGLGLSIARSLVKLHGGQIWVESTPGQGSRFYFTVPIEPLSR
jgi:signal transduction histidine kinase